MNEATTVIHGSPKRTFYVLEISKNDAALLYPIDRKPGKAYYPFWAPIDELMEIVEIETEDLDV